MNRLRAGAAWCCHQVARFFHWLGDLVAPAAPNRPEE